MRLVRNNKSRGQLFKSRLALPGVNLKFKAIISNSLFVNLKIFLQASCLDQLQFSFLKF